MADATPADTAGRWVNQIAVYDREFKKWGGRVEKIIKRYRDDSRSGSSSTSTARFNILWSNVQTLIPATFLRLPEPDVSRRFRDNDPVGRVAALIIERALDYEIQHYADYRDSLTQVLQDRFLGGRGTAWVRYEPHIKQVDEGAPDDGVQVTEDAEAGDQAAEGEDVAPAEELDYECAPVDYVHWKDFGHTVARTWEEVTAVWRVVYMTRDALIERFGEKEGEKIPLDAKPEELTKNQIASEAEFSRAKIYEIWDKTTKTACWLSKSQSKIIDTKADPLGLEEFWPCPKPLFATLTNDSLVPVPDFIIYQDQQATLDTLADRIDGLVRALAVKGVYDASQGAELARLFTEAENNTLIPMKNWAAFAEKNGLKGAIDLVDLTPIAMALKEAYGAMANVKEQVYELTGISDIIRGQGDPSDTATAQQLKGQYASLRLKAYQEDVARFATGLLQLKAQIICGKFNPETIAEMAGVQQLTPEDQQMVPQALQLLKNNPLRGFRIEIAADTLVQMDEQAEKQSRTEFLTAVGGYLDKALPVVQASPQAGELVIGLLKFGVTGFKVGKTVEGMIDSALDKLKQLSANPPAKPDPEMAKVQAGQQTAQMQIQSQERIEQFKAQLEQQKQQNEAALQQHLNSLEAQRGMQQAQLQAQVEQAKANFQAQLDGQRLEFERWQTQQNNDTKIIIAQITAKAQLDNTLAAAETKADSDFSGQMDPQTKPAKKKPLDTLLEAQKGAQDETAKRLDDHAKQIKEIAQAVTNPKKRRAVKGADGAWTVETVQ